MIKTKRILTGVGDVYDQKEDEERSLHHLARWAAEKMEGLSLFLSDVREMSKASEVRAERGGSEAGSAGLSVRSKAVKPHAYHCHPPLR